MPVALALLLAGCAAPLHRFAVREPMRVDGDMVPFAPRPKKYVAAEAWDTVDNTVFEPLSRTFALDSGRPAVNVNALDEVPDSSWFTNRIDELVGDLASVARGTCEPEADPRGPWTVVAGKPNGANPGFMVEHASGRKFFYKPDTHPGGRASTADVVGTRVHYAAGYSTACVRVLFLDPATVQLSPTAMAEDFVGDEVPFTRVMLDKALARGVLRDGKIRGTLSELIPGKSLGPWADFGTRPDDPNDVIPHEDRRELRGSYVLGAWLSHYDAREQNSLDMWVETGPDKRGYVRHYMFDFGDCLGSQSAWPRVTRRRGHVYELDWPIAFVELITFGLLPRPWRDPQLGPTGSTLGYFAAAPFDPDHYRTAYPFGPYTRVTEADAAWGARILARISPAMIRAIIDQAQLADPVTIQALLDALHGRRTALLRRYLGRLSPLTRPRVDASVAAEPRLCVDDAWVEGGLGTRAERPLAARVLAGSRPGPIASWGGAAPYESCVLLPAAPAEYTVVELRAGPQRPLRVHLAAAAGRYLVVGLERR
jgi:hypothetical protein